MPQGLSADTRRLRFPIRPDWSPVGVYGGYQRVATAKSGGGASLRRVASRHLLGCHGGSWGESCGCWAF